MRLSVVANLRQGFLTGNLFLKADHLLCCWRQACGYLREYGFGIGFGDSFSAGQRACVLVKIGANLLGELWRFDGLFIDGVETLVRGVRAFTGPKVVTVGEVSSGLDEILVRLRSKLTHIVPRVPGFARIVWDNFLKVVDDRPMFLAVPSVVPHGPS
ncbi:hypothetical protein FZI91_02275 [Mycobacterium sp. CBMA271]|nr:hypothetical protein [Mycobacteroides sp. CBMA 271]